MGNYEEPPCTSEGSRFGSKSDEEENVNQVIYQPSRANCQQNLAWMAQSPLDVHGLLHDMPRHPEKHPLKYDLEKGTMTEDHINNV